MVQKSMGGIHGPVIDLPKDRQKNKYVMTWAGCPDGQWASNFLSLSSLMRCSALLVLDIARLAQHGCSTAH